MRADGPYSRKHITTGCDLNENRHAPGGGSFVTPRGTKYWSAGSIPLIAPELLGDIIASASDIAVVVSEEGRVLSIVMNPNHRSFGELGHWEGRDMRDFLTAECIDKFEHQLRLTTSGKQTRGAAELNHTDARIWEFPIRYSFHPIGPDGAVLMLGHDLRPIAEMQQQLVKAQMALERDYETQREYDTRYRVLMNTTHDAMVFVSLGTGRISDLNNAAAQALGGTREELLGAAFAQEFDGRRKGEVMETLVSRALDEAAAPLELQARRSRRKLSVRSMLFRAAGERIMLCRMERQNDVEGISDELSTNLSALYQNGVDAIVFTDVQGTIRAANAAFLNLTDAAHASAVKGRSLGDFLARGGVDLKVLVENASRAGQMRMYATRMQSLVGTQVSVEVSATYLNDRAHPAIVFVIRDASRAEAMRSPGMTVSDDAVRSVMELVGSATLKDIVAETTDVVEKMCIETAVELTRNNRVAAAEMLGLSRQSLYVKLRKFGLLHRGEDA
jgi:transcriptional regulator PpsR